MNTNTPDNSPQAEEVTTNPIMSDINTAIDVCDRIIHKNSRYSTVFITLAILIWLALYGFFSANEWIESSRLVTAEGMADGLKPLDEAVRELRIDVNSIQENPAGFNEAQMKSLDSRVSSLRDQTGGMLTHLNRIKEDNSTRDLYLIVSAGVSFAILIALYRYHQTQVSKHEQYRLGYMRMRIAVNLNKKTPPEVLTALTQSAFSFDTGKRNKEQFENPLPGHPGGDATTSILNRILDSFEVTFKPKGGK